MFSYLYKKTIGKIKDDSIKIYPSNQKNTLYKINNTNNISSDFVYYNTNWNHERKREVIGNREYYYDTNHIYYFMYAMNKMKYPHIKHELRFSPHYQAFNYLIRKNNIVTNYWNDKHIWYWNENMWSIDTICKIPLKCEMDEYETMISFMQ